MDIIRFKGMLCFLAILCCVSFVNWKFHKHNMQLHSEKTIHVHDCTGHCNTFDDNIMTYMRAYSFNQVCTCTSSMHSYRALPALGYRLPEVVMTSAGSALTDLDAVVLLDRLSHLLKA